MAVIDLDVIRRAELKRDPYDYVVNSQFVRKEAIPAINADFPSINVAGFHPAAELPLKGAFRELIEELEGPELSAVLSEKFGIDFSVYPRLVTVRKVSAAHEGRIHCDGKSKIMSLLVYLNEGWQDTNGRLRVLRGEHDFEDYSAEIEPNMGTVFAFLRADHSWHGHKPFVGERRVVQVAWVKSMTDIERKKKRHKISKFFKKLFGITQDGY